MRIRVVLAELDDGDGKNAACGTIYRYHSDGVAKALALDWD